MAILRGHWGDLPANVSIELLSKLPIELLWESLEGWETAAIKVNGTAWRRYTEQIHMTVPPIFTNYETDCIYFLGGCLGLSELGNSWMFWRWSLRRAVFGERKTSRGYKAIESPFHTSHFVQVN